jgi:hypothetical protein
MGTIPAQYTSVVSTVREALVAGYGTRLVSLAIFGSIARGVATPESDIDLLVVANGLPNGRMSRVREFASMENGMLSRHPELSRCELSPIIKTPHEVALGSPLFWDMTEDVIILLDEGGFLAHSLQKVKERLVQLKARKVVRGDAWYWVYKGDYTPGEVFEI